MGWMPFLWIYRLNFWKEIESAYLFPDSANIFQIYRSKKDEAAKNLFSRLTLVSTLHLCKVYTEVKAKKKRAMFGGKFEELHEPKIN